MDMNTLRGEIIGGHTLLKTPYGDRLMTYADYTASGRNLRFVEDCLLQLETTYANTHTEDNHSGHGTTMLVREAKLQIRKMLGGTEEYMVILTGTGATGAIHRLSEILGIHEVPAAQEYRSRLQEKIANENPAYRAAFERLEEENTAGRPVVFITPYEHHSNVLPWREGNAEVVEIPLDFCGRPDSAALEDLLRSPRFSNRMKIGAFSAASNVTGIITPVRELAAILHAHGGYAFFDYAASAPYVPIRAWVNDADYLDGVCLSPHKFLGGPGASGLLMFHQRIYRKDLPPTFAGGGTVDYVNDRTQDYKTDIEAREDAGTPAILQAVRTALALELKERIGTDHITCIEADYLKRALSAFRANPHIELIGQDCGEQESPDMERLCILSFNIRHGSGLLHPRFVTRLLNDLFGIQARAGCSCAGPYGHRLLGIGPEESARYRSIILEGYEAMKPGWVRMNFHYSLDESSFRFLLDAVLFVAEHGVHFLQDYRLDPATGLWSHRSNPESAEMPLHLVSMLHPVKPPKPYDAEYASESYERYLAEARRRKTDILASLHSDLTKPDAMALTHHAADQPYCLYGSETWPDLAWFLIGKIQSGIPSGQC